MATKKKGALLSVAVGMGAVALATTCSASAVAQDFYHGKQITLIVGGGVGGGYDLYARLLVRHWPKFIPGEPIFIVQNLPAAGGLVAMNTMAHTSPRDGTAFVATQNHLAVEPLLGLTGPRENVKYNPRELNWIGSTTKEVPVVALWHTAGVETFEDLIGKEVLVGSSGTATSDSVYPRIMNKLVGTNFKIIEGYKGNPELAQAIEQGEVQGRAGWYLSSLMSSKPDWVANKNIRMLVQVALERYPSLPDLPLLTSFTKTQANREQLEFALSYLLMGRPYVAPPGVPADRVKILRESFMQTLNSQAFKDEAKRLNLDLSPMSGEEIDALIERQFKTKPDVIENVRAMMAAAGK